MRISRCMYIVVLACATLGLSLSGQTITDATRLSSGVIDQEVAPRSVEQLQDIVRNASGPISVAGARYSQGGQVWAHHGIVIDTQHLNRILDVDITHKRITVETGTPWRHIQEMLSPIGLSPQVMQSYNDFTVGGALSVNAHGRDITGSMIATVISLDVLLPDGQIVTADREHNYDLFRAVIGGYGACGIIVRATLALTDNHAIRRATRTMHISEYVDYLRTQIIGNDDVVLHNANLYPKAFETLHAITWCIDDTSEAVRTTEIIRPDSAHIVDTCGEMMVRRLWGGKYLRQKIEHLITESDEQTHRNYEIGRPIATLGPWTQIISSNILQEYFIPLAYLEQFIDDLRAIRAAYNVNVLNASLRYVPADTESILSYAPYDCCSVVLYINVVRVPNAFEHAQAWTQELVDAALRCHGTYYLPYHMFASLDQFRHSYPGWRRLRELKNVFDPHWKLSNSLIETYLV